MVDLFYKRASLLERFFALVIDVFFIDVLFMGLSMFDLRIGWPLLFVAYFASFDGMAGTTLGKWSLGLVVVDKKGNPPGLVRGLFRTVFFPLSVVLMRPIHDSLTSTCVVREWE